VPDNGVWYLKCSKPECTDLFACVHTVDAMMTSPAEDLLIPSGITSLPMAGEFPDPAAPNDQLTSEKLGSFKVQVSDAINAYGTRKVSIVTPTDPAFLMTMNPEDAIVSIYTALKHFINSQVFYVGGDRFGSCKSPDHRMSTQGLLNWLTGLVGAYPMLEFWDKVGKLTLNACVVCMWNRHKPVVVPGPDDSGLGSL
jgi:hypothetical protein